MSKYLLDGRLKTLLNDELDKEDIIFTKANPNISDEIKYHPDVVCLKIDDLIFAEPVAFEYLSKIIDKSELIKGEKQLSGDYPGDIAYNVAFINGYLIGNLKYTDEKIIEYCKRKNYNLINVKQGYAKCSILKINDEAVITSDISIYKTLEELKIFEIMYLNPSEIFLSERHNGFIGGAGGFAGEALCFFGDISTLSDFEKIDRFISAQKISYKNILKIEKLTDFGSFVEL